LGACCRFGASRGRTAMMSIIWRELDGGCLIARFPGRSAVRPSSPVMPMGKYRGALIREVVEHDPGYVGWLIEQDWFFYKYPRESECLVECISINPDIGPSAA
jgi:hypothetical protein